MVLIDSLYSHIAFQPQWRLGLWESALIEDDSQIFSTVAWTNRSLRALQFTTGLSGLWCWNGALSSNAIISETEGEVLISNYLAGLLGTVIGDCRERLWWLRSDGNDKIGRSYEPQHWWT